MRGFTQSLKFALGEQLVRTTAQRDRETSSEPAFITRRARRLPLGAKANSSAGFTLIELLVVTGILIVISGLILANNRQFRGRILLENLAYDVALSVRQAQVYGISVRQFGQTFDVSYGVHFNPQASSQTYSLFGDIGGVDANGLWDAGEDVSPSPYTIEGGYFIATLCVPAGADAETCVPATQVDAVFRRPEPDACISKDGVSAITGEYKCTGGHESARIVLQSPQGERVSIVVEATGQISVQ